MIALMFAPFVGVFFLFIFILIVQFLAAAYPSFGFLVYPVFIATNTVMILGGIIRSRSK